VATLFDEAKLVVNQWMPNGKEEPRIPPTRLSPDEPAGTEAACHMLKKLDIIQHFQHGLLE
jgi:hypothetical protein